MTDSGSVHNSFGGSGPPADGDLRSVPPADQLAYVADMILELSQIARASRLSTLAGILDLAHAEARLQVRRLEAS